MPDLLHRVRQVRTAPLPHLRQRSLLLLLLQHHQQGEVSPLLLRACDKCAYHYSDSEREVFKEEALRLMTSLCVEYLAVKMRTEEQLKNLELEIPKEEDKLKERKAV